MISSMSTLIVMYAELLTARRLPKDFDSQHVKIDRGVELIKLAVLSAHNPLEDRIGERADGSRRDTHTHGSG